MNEVNLRLMIDLITALSNYAWPAVALIVILRYGKHIPALLGRVRKGKFLGTEWELNEQVTEFRQEIRILSSELPDRVSTATVPESIEQPDMFYQPRTHMIPSGLDSDIDKVLAESATSPTTALIRLGALIDIALLKVSAKSNWVPVERVTPHNMFEKLTELNRIPNRMMSTWTMFHQLRNQVVHGINVEEGSVLRIIDVGINLLQVIRAIRLETYVVDNIVDVYADANCTEKRTDVKGIILEVTSPDGETKSKRIYATTRWSYYQPGKEVSWEWNMANKWNDTWYLSQETGLPTFAWSGCAEFAGRHLEELLHRHSSGTGQSTR